MLELLTASIYEGLFDSNSQSPDSSNAKDTQTDTNSPGLDEKIRKYILYNKLKNLNKRLVDFKNSSNETQLNQELENVIYTINIVIKFYDLFSIQDIEKMSIGIVTSTDDVMKKVKSHKQNQQNKTEEVLRAEL